MEIVKRPPLKRVEFGANGKPIRTEQAPDNTAKKPIEKQDNRPKKPIERHIIPQDIYENKGHSKKKPDNKKKDKDFNKKEEQERISLEKAASQHHRKKVQKEEVVEKVTSIVVTKAMTIQELADKIQKTPAEIVKFLMFQGVMATVNQLIDVDVIKKVCAEYELEVLEEDLEAYIEEELQKEEQKKVLSEVDKKLLKKRAPVVSIMGHVDHGKTTLLDSIRASKHKIVSTEVGGITQSIGAYTVYLDNNKEKKIVFVDTPGHEAFTEMRARGAKATDIAILVVAADDGIMPQTIEAINHAKAADVPIIIAVNKVDKPSADPDRVLQQLTEHGLVPEAWGGDTITVKVSALQGTGIDDLLEYIWILAELKDLKANPKAEASGVVIEANLDKGKGPVATVLVQKGTLHVGDFISAGASHGKVRAMVDDKGRRVKEATPSTPVEILGLNGVPDAGEVFLATENEKEARTIAEAFVAQSKEQLIADTKARLSLDGLFSQIQAGNIKELNIIVKADVQGSVEAVKQSLMKLSNEEVVVKCIHGGVGAINESDVTLAGASNAIIIGFNVRMDVTAKATAEREGVDVRLYKVIYQAIEDIQAAMKGMLDPVYEEKIIGHAEVRQIFRASAVGNIAGSYVMDGVFQRGCKVRITREGEQIFEGELASLKRFKDDVKEVKAGFECGLVFEGFDKMQEFDIVEAYTMVEVPR